MIRMQTAKRLYTEFIPEHYQLSLTIDRIAHTFSGTVTIRGEATGSSFAVHAKELTFETVTVDGKTAKFTHGENDEIAITHPKLAAGNHTVVIGYRGTITESLHGLYPCRFMVDGKEQELIMTQFESHYAREMFPCVDEPEAKAAFDVTVSTQSGVTVLGNMPVTSQAEENGQLVTTFATTPRMSTYLLALVIGDMHARSAKTKDGVEVSVYATKAQPADSLNFALQEAVDVIEFFNDYFGVPYPLPKSDHVAVPDFSNGAMENWGLITYRETALLADPKTTSIEAKEYISTVIAHELSHQWFGNLVTMKWWNNLWLNESFATIMEYVAVDSLHPEWNIWQEFNSMEGVMALRRDAINGVQSVQTDVNHPDEISTIFDGAIVYAKGARLMNMMRQYVGEAAFRDGLKAYFEKHAYGNTSENDLWQALSEASGQDVGAFMTPWISQPGFPVVTIATNGQSVELSQMQCFVGAHEVSSRRWPIPLDCEGLPGLMTDESATYPKPDALLFLNRTNTGHYITNYDDALREDILHAIESGDLPEGQRVQFLNEQTMLARAELIESSSLITLLDAYRGESSEKAWDAMAATINELKKFVENDEASEKKFKQFVATLAKPHFTRLGWESSDDEPLADTKLRTTILGCMLYGEDPDVLREANERYQAADFADLNPELRPLIADAAVRHFEQPEMIESLLSRYRESQIADLKNDIAGALTSTKNDATINRLVGLLTDTSLIRTQDTAQWFVMLLRNRYGREKTWSWLQNNWEWVEKTFGDDKSFDRFPRYAAAILSRPQHLEEYKTFFTPMRSDLSLVRTIDMGIRDLEGRITLIERQAPGVRQLLNNL